MIIASQSCGVAVTFSILVQLSVEGLLRLVGEERGEGRLEYCSGGEWGTVCNQGWDLIDARVAYAQLIPGGDPNGKHNQAHWLWSLNPVVGFVLHETPFQ